MRIGCLQFAPRIGDVDHNLNRADAILNRANPQDLDLLVLPELAFTGYNFRSLQHISPFLEPTVAGISSLWARSKALKYNCAVTVGYPEKVDITAKWPADPEYYNSAITVNSEGETVANYRKTHLYYTDERWALEGPSGFFGGYLSGVGHVAMGICMDLNPYKFEAPWDAWEFANHILRVEANLVIISMAWLTREDARMYSRIPREPDMETLSYWLARLEPIIRAETDGEIIVVFANRCGVEEEAVYAGSSAVLGIKDGEVRVYGILGRGERELLVVDTDKRPQAKLVSVRKALAPVRTSGIHASENLQLSTEGPMFDDIIPEDPYDFSPVSPRDARHPQAYYDPSRSPIAAQAPIEVLISSTGKTTLDAPSPASTAPDRSPSPKSEMYSSHESFTSSDDEPRSSSEDEPRPSTVESVSTSSPQHDRGPVHSLADSAAEASKTTKLTSSFSSDNSYSSSELGEEDEEDEYSSAMDDPQTPRAPRAPKRATPHSAAAVPEQFQSMFTRNPLGPRSRHISPRPTSTVW